jgi:hypothetical protein
MVYNFSLAVLGMGRIQDPFQIPRAGLEIAPVAGLASINVNGSVGPVPATEFVGELTLGGLEAKVVQEISVHISFEPACTIQNYLDTKHDSGTGK